MLSSALAMPSSARLGLRTDHPLLLQVANLTADVRRYITLTTALNFLTGLGNTILLLFLGIGRRSCGVFCPASWAIFRLSASGSP